MGNQYGPYVMYFLSQLLQRQNAEKKGGMVQAADEAEKDMKLFTYDETESLWHRETKLELLKHFCPEGYEAAARYGHFIIGHSQNGNCIGIPGRFLRDEQPAGGRTGFTLWQPIKGGEQFFDTLETMDDVTADSVYGYWIAALDEKTLRISEI